MMINEVLIVDDDPDDRELFTEAIMFVSPNIQVSTKRDGEEFLFGLSGITNLPDLIFLDLNMPRKSGKECLVELRMNQKFMNIPVVIYTTSLNPIDIEDTYEQGAFRFFRKPNSFEELKRLLHRLLFAELGTSATTSRQNFVIKSA